MKCKKKSLGYKHSNIEYKATKTIPNSTIQYLVDAHGRPLDRPLREPHSQLRPGPVRRPPPLLGEHGVGEALVDPLVVGVVHEAVVQRADEAAASHAPKPKPHLPRDR